nr:uncharacterized protein LOC104096727 [Nicotiana tomentosiformis]
MVDNPKGDNNMWHSMSAITRSGKGGNAPTSNEKQLVNDDQMIQEEKIPSNNVQAEAPLTKPPPPYPQRLTKQTCENQFEKFVQMMKGLFINVPLVEDLKQMFGYAKFMNYLVTKKRSVNFETIKVTHKVSAIIYSMALKLEDPGAFTIPCTIGSADFFKALCDLGASINLMPYSVFKNLGIGKSRPTSMRLQMADRSMKMPFGVNKDVLVRVDKFILSADFVILDCEIDYEVPIILCRPFLTTCKALCDLEAGELIFWVDDEQVVFHMCKSMRQPNSNEVCSFVDLVTNVIIDDTSATINVGDMLEVILHNLDDNEMDGFMEYLNSLRGMWSYNYAPQKLSSDLENRNTPSTKPSIEETPTLKLKICHHTFAIPGSDFDDAPDDGRGESGEQASMARSNKKVICEGINIIKVRNLKVKFDQHTLDVYLGFDDVEPKEYLEKLALKEEARSWLAQILAPGLLPLG